MNWEFVTFGFIPAVLVSVSWAGCPPPLSCASSHLHWVLCSCIGSSCSYPWPDWLTALVGQRHITIKSKTNVCTYRGFFFFSIPEKPTTFSYMSTTCFSLTRNKKAERLSLLTLTLVTFGVSLVGNLLLPLKSNTTTIISFHLSNTSSAPHETSVCVWERLWH